MFETFSVVPNNPEPSFEGHGMLLPNVQTGFKLAQPHPRPSSEGRATTLPVFTQFPLVFLNWWLIPIADVGHSYVQLTDASQPSEDESDLIRKPLKLIGSH